MPVRKLIVKTCVREVILDNDSVTITYNFTENYTKYKISKETIEDIKRQSLKKTAYNKNRCSNKLPSLPPIFAAGFCRNEKRTTRRVVLFSYSYIILKSLGQVLSLPLVKLFCSSARLSGLPFFVLPFASASSSAVNCFSVV